MPVTSGLLAIVPGNFAFHPLGARRLCQCRQHSALTFNTGKIGYGSRRVWALCSIQRLLKECVQMEVIYGKMTVMVRRCLFLQWSSPLSQAIMPYMAAVQTDQTNEHSLLPVSQQEPGGFWCFDGMFLCFSLLIFYK